MIYAVLGNSQGKNTYPLATKVQGVLDGPYQGYKVVVLNGTMIDGVYEKTGAYCPIRYEIPTAKKNPRRGLPINLQKGSTPWSHLPPRRKP